MHREAGRCCAMPRIKDVYFGEGFVKMLARLADNGRQVLHFFCRVALNFTPLLTDFGLPLARRATVPFSEHEKEKLEPC